VVAGILTSVQVYPLTDYFDPGCTYLKAKQVPYTSTSTITDTTMLPYWIVFYEFNQTFIMYPPDTATNDNPTIHIELKCCNSLDQCVSNTFSVTSTNTIPDTVTLETTYYLL